MEKPNVVVLTGAGISAESGLKTFRDSGGLWEGYSIEDVATPDAWRRNPALVLQFYNERRKALRRASPNAAHYALAKLEAKYNVTVVTQNVDNLHEQAGSSRIIHLHGELTKARSSRDPSLVYDIEGDELNVGDCCERGSQLRPHIVWFGEAVPMMDEAIKTAEQADVFMVVGTALVVYPAAGLVEYVPETCRIYVIDPNRPQLPRNRHVEFVEAQASVGVPKVVERLMEREP